MRRSTAIRLLALGLSAGACSSDGSSSPDDSGAIAVTVSTTGAGKDLDGYLLVVPGHQPSRIPFSGTVPVGEFSAGTYTVELQDIADNCELVSVLDPVEISADSTTIVSISVDCHLDLTGRVLVSGSELPKLQILAMRPDGSQRFRVIESDSQDADPDVSPDGQSLVFARYSSASELRILDVSTGAITALPAQGLGQFRPDWSPDGNKIAYMVIDAQGSLIWVVDADGGNPHAVTTAPGFDSEPSWSPDGNWILYAHNGNLQRVSPAGGTPVPIPCSGGCIQAAYSPDGQSIIYTGNSAGPPVNQDIYRMDADGQNVEQLTTATENDADAAWSPDGASLVFIRIFENNHLHLFRLDLDGSDPVDIGTGHFDQAPDWGPSSSPSPPSVTTLEHRTRPSLYRRGE